MLMKKSREIVVQLLFSFDMGCSNEKDLVLFFMRELSLSQRNVRIAYQKACTIWEIHETLDQKIAETSRDWVVEQIFSVEKNILRLALFEMLIEKEDPPQMAITEAIRLCRKFSTPKVGGFVNAILDAHYPKDP